MASEANFTFEAVFFDLDGTLYDKRGLSLRLVWAALRRGRPCLRLLSLERKVRRELAGQKAGFEELFEGVAGKAALPLEDIRRWYREWYMPAMVAALRHYRPNESVMAKARMFKASGCKIAVLSDYGCVREKLEALGADPQLFDALLDAPSLGGFKPCPDAFLAACERLGADPARCALVGDRPDTDGGCTAVGMTYIPK